MVTMARGRLQFKSPLQPSPDRLELYPAGAVLAEINLLYFPLCLLSNNNLDELLKEAAHSKKSHIRYRLKTEEGEVREWRVNPNIESGYTRPFDKKVIITVLKLVTDEGLPPPVLWKLGSAKRICRVMGISDKGTNPRMVRESLKRIAGTPIYAETFYLKKDGDYWREETRSKGGVFTLWNVFWKGEKLPDGEIADSIYLQFNIPFILSLHDFYVKPLDYDYWLKLSPLAQRLYELTGLKFYGLKDSPYITFTYPELCQAMPLQPQEYLSNAKQILDRAHRQLLKTQWLSKVEWRASREQRRLDSKQPWTLRYYPGSRALMEITQARERLRRYQKMVQREKLPLWHDVQGWAQILTEELQDRAGKNRGFYIQLGKLVVQGRIKDSLIWEAVSNAKVEDREGNVKKSRSAFFTDYLKRKLKERGQDLNALLQEV